MSYIVKTISERHKEVDVTYERFFQGIGMTEGSGYAFSCDEEGNLIVDEYYETRKKNMEFCIAHPEKYIDKGIVKDEHHYTENAKALCSCGETMELYNEYMGACECPNCGQWYNLFGQALNKPQYWEEDEDY